MKVAIHQPNYLPGLNGLGSFWPKAKAADIFILLDTVQFSAHSFTCRTLLPNGHMVYKGMARARNRTPYLTVPCKHPHMQPIRDILIDWSHYRPTKQLKAIESKTKLCNGRFAPWVESLRYALSFKSLDHYDHLVDWNELLIKKLAELLHVGCQWRRASQIKMTALYACDCAMLAREAEHRIIDLCYAVNATTYLTGPSWKRYAPNLKEVLKEHGIEMLEVQ